MHFNIGKRGMSLLEILICISIITVALLLFIRIFPYIFMLNRKTEDIHIAKNLTENLFQTLRAEINTSITIIDIPTLTVPVTNPDLYFRDQPSIPANNLVNPYKCYWQLVQASFYSPGGLDTYLDANNLTADTIFAGINPSRFEPLNDPPDDDWIATKKFWIDWRNLVESQLPPGKSTSPDRASAIVTARYLSFDSNNNLVLAEGGSYPAIYNQVDGGTGQPTTVAGRYVLELTVSMYWRPREMEGTYNRNINAPKYKLSTMLIPSLNLVPRPTPTP